MGVPWSKIKDLRSAHLNPAFHVDLPQPLNVVRMSDGVTWKLIDLDAAVAMDTPLGQKLSTAHVPPEVSRYGRRSTETTPSQILLPL